MVLSPDAKTAIKEAVGATGGIFTVSSAIPQIISTFRSNSDKINPIFMYMLLVGSAFWFTYAVLTNVWQGEGQSKYNGIALIVFQSLSLVFLTAIAVKISIINKPRLK
jgi:uncharacterized protein with PQ loop repeat